MFYAQVRVSETGALVVQGPRVMIEACRKRHRAFYAAAAAGINLSQHCMEEQTSKARNACVGTVITGGTSSLQQAHNL